MFDSTIGGTTVLMPYGGKYQLTETEGSVHKIPLRHGVTNTVSMLTYGYNPEITSWSHSTDQLMLSLNQWLKSWH